MLIFIIIFVVSLDVLGLFFANKSPVLKLTFIIQFIYFYNKNLINFLVFYYFYFYAMHKFYESKSLVLKTGIWPRDRQNTETLSNRLMKFNGLNNRFMNRRTCVHFSSWAFDFFLTTKNTFIEIGVFYKKL